MGTAPHHQASGSISADDKKPRKSRTPEERPVTVCPNCFLAVPAKTGRCEYCE